MTQDSISRFRRFARAVTTELGALDTSFLGRGRPLGSARLLNAVGRGIVDVADLRAELRLDSGLSSRLLRGLEREGLIVTTPSPEDGRRRIVHLTEAGHREYRAYEALSSARAEAVLARHGRPDLLLAAMDRVASAFGAERIVVKAADPESAEARHCLGAYYEELAARFEEGFEVARSRDPQARQMRPPLGAFLVALSDGLPVGCVGLKGAGDGSAEVKRLWVSPAARGLGLGRRLMQAVEGAAAGLSIRRLRLDTNRALSEALDFYRAAGWTEIERFNDDPYADYFFEKRIRLPAEGEAEAGGEARGQGPDASLRLD